MIVNVRKLAWPAMWTLIILGLLLGAVGLYSWNRLQVTGIG
jgi:hypothetical protein